MKLTKKQLLLLALAVVLVLVVLTLLPAGNEQAPAPSADDDVLSTLPPTAAQPADAQPDETFAGYAGDYSYTDGVGALDEYGTYSGTDDVAYYLHVFGHLPDNYITKAEAEDAGWVSTEGNLWDVAYGMSIGGDRFGNREGLLPAGETYYECDVNYAGGYRGEERIIYTDDGDVYYTADHYESFIKLY